MAARGHETAPAPRGDGGEGANLLAQKDSLGARMAAWINTFMDSKSDSMVDQFVAEARKVGWLK